jgi:hypothetical protein
MFRGRCGILSRGRRAAESTPDAAPLYLLQLRMEVEKELISGHLKRISAECHEYIAQERLDGTLHASHPSLLPSRGPGLRAPILFFCAHAIPAHVTGPWLPSLLFRPQMAQVSVLPSLIKSRHLPGP